jgi:hypothetical protein
MCYRLLSQILLSSTEESMLMSPNSPVNDDNSNPYVSNPMENQFRYDYEKSQAERLAEFERLSGRGPEAEQPTQPQPQNSVHYQMSYLEYEAWKDYEIHRRNKGVIAFAVSLIPYIGGIIAFFLITNFFSSLKLYPQVKAGKGWAILASIFASFSVLGLLISIGSLLFSDHSDNGSSGYSSPAKPSFAPESSVTDEYDMGACWAESGTTGTAMTPVSCTSSAADYIISGSNPVRSYACLNIDSGVATSYYKGSYYCLSEL